MYNLLSKKTRNPIYSSLAEVRNGKSMHGKLSISLFILEIERLKGIDRKISYKFENTGDPISSSLAKVGKGNSMPGKHSISLFFILEIETGVDRTISRSKTLEIALNFPEVWNGKSRSKTLGIPLNFPEVWNGAAKLSISLFI